VPAPPSSSFEKPIEVFFSSGNKKVFNIFPWISKIFSSRFFKEFSEVMKIRVKVITGLGAQTMVRSASGGEGDFE
jgi:hypothetical protein